MQTYKKFKVFEIDYGCDKNQVYKGSQFYSIPMYTHAHAHNFLCYKAVSEGYDCVFNVNIDDMYHPQRIELQLPFMKAGYDVVSCNHHQINEDSTLKKPVPDYFSNMDIYKHAKQGHNVISHPGCVYSKNFIENSGMLIPEEIPLDDFNLWRRSYDKFTFYIAPYVLLYYRDNKTSVSAKK